MVISEKISVLRTTALIRIFMLFAITVTAAMVFTSAKAESLRTKEGHVTEGGYSMNISEKIKEYRKAQKISQEQLAEKLNVSRQAITKWEIGTGLPEIENIIAIANLLSLSVDELLDVAQTAQTQTDYTHESLTVYDIDRIKDFDLSLGEAHKISLEGYSGEKLRILLASNTIDVEKTVKVKMDDNGGRMDVDIKHAGAVPLSEIKGDLAVKIFIPQQYVQRVEVSAQTQAVSVKNMMPESFEFDGRVSSFNVNNVEGHIEVNCNLDMDVMCNGFTGKIDINQIKGVSTLHIPSDMDFHAVCKGIANKILYKKAGIAADDFSNPSAKNEIELNGLKSELIINRF